MSILLFGFLFKNLSIALLGSSSLIFFVLTFVIVKSYSVIKIDGDTITLENISNSITITELERVTTWWSYDFGNSSIVFSEGTQGKTRGHANKINCYVKFEGNNGIGYIYEQIHLGDKFPNNHEYLPDEEVDSNKLINVWDIDNCLKSLNLIPDS